MTHYSHYHHRSKIRQASGEDIFSVAHARGMLLLLLVTEPEPLDEKPAFVLAGFGSSANNNVVIRLSMWYL